MFPSHETRLRVDSPLHPLTGCGPDRLVLAKVIDDTAPGPMEDEGDSLHTLAAAMHLQESPVILRRVRGSLLRTVCQVYLIVVNGFEQAALSRSEIADQLTAFELPHQVTNSGLDLLRRPLQYSGDDNVGAIFLQTHNDLFSLRGGKREARPARPSLDGVGR